MPNDWSSARRLAVMADIHGNLPALEAVLVDADAQGVEGMLVLGDSLSRAPDPLGVLQVLCQRDALLIRGNVETYLLAYRQGSAPAAWYGSPQWAALDWTARQLDDHAAALVSALPEQRSLRLAGAPALRLVHGSPRDSAESLYVASDANVRALYAQAGLLRPGHMPTPVEELLPSLPEPTLLCGHTHLPWVYRDGERLALNCGSVGMSVAGEPRAWYAILGVEDGRWRPTLRAVPYDLVALYRRFVDSGALAEGGAMARAFMLTMLTGRNVIIGFIRSVARLREEGLAEQGAWEQAVACFPWDDLDAMAPTTGREEGPGSRARRSVTPTEAFAFRDPGPLVDAELTLVLTRRYPGDPARGWVPAYTFDMRHSETGERLGDIDLRIGTTPRLQRFGGHLGYEVLPEHRGHRYAARSCRLLLSLAQAHGMNDVWITCDMTNVASRRTAERAGFTLVDIVPFMERDEPSLYATGRRFTCRYRRTLP